MTMVARINFLKSLVSSSDFVISVFTLIYRYSLIKEVILTFLISKFKELSNKSCSDQTTWTVNVKFILCFGSYSSPPPKRIQLIFFLKESSQRRLLKRRRIHASHLLWFRCLIVYIQYTMYHNAKIIQLTSFPKERSQIFHSGIVIHCI